MYRTFLPVQNVLHAQFLAILLLSNKVAGLFAKLRVWAMHMMVITTNGIDTLLALNPFELLIRRILVDMPAPLSVDLRVRIVWMYVYKGLYTLRSCC